MYWEYFKYIVEHKKNVFIESYKMGMIWSGITHDLSKFLPSEFFPYARFFFKKDRANNYKQSDEHDPDFLAGWMLHQKRNKHHWNYWICVNRKEEIIPVPMPQKYVMQMVADWKGMSRKFGGSWVEYYRDNGEKMILHRKTTSRIDSFIYRELLCKKK